MDAIILFFIGKNYWANIYTQETTWDEPEAVKKHKQMQVNRKTKNLFQIYVF